MFISGLLQDLFKLDLEFLVHGFFIFEFKLFFIYNSFIFFEYFFSFFIRIIFFIVGYFIFIKYSFIVNKSLLKFVSFSLDLVQINFIFIALFFQYLIFSLKFSIIFFKFQKFQFQLFNFFIFKLINCSSFHRRRHKLAAIKIAYSILDNRVVKVVLNPSQNIFFILQIILLNKLSHPTYLVLQIIHLLFQSRYYCTLRIFIHHRLILDLLCPVCVF